MNHLKWTFLSTLAFFGLNPSYRKTLHKQIFDLVYHGKGGFTWSDVYDLPVWLRVFYIQSINQVIKEENKRNKAPTNTKRATPPKFRRK